MSVTNDVETQAGALPTPRLEPRVRNAIAVLVTSFPRIDETFILREINELERHGQPVVLVPLLRDHGRIVHEEAKPWVGRALYMPLLSGVIVRANLKRMLRHPRRYFSLLGRLIAGTMFRPSVLVRTLALFPKSVYLADLLPRLGVRHLHAHFAVHPATMAYIAHFFSNVTYSFTAHGPDVFVHRLLLREKIARAKFVRTVSTFTKAFMAGLYPVESDGKIEVVHVGVNPTVYAEEASRASKGGTRTRLLSVASLTGAKGFTFLVDAVARLVGEGADLECTIVGDGPMRDVIRARIEQHGLADRIRMTGALPQHEVARLIADCDIFVLPSVIAYNGQMDGIPISLMEAMAAGRPVVASAISGIPELVQHGVSGVLVDATHPERIASSVRMLMEDPELRARMGAAGQARVREAFDVSRAAAELISHFDRHEKVRAVPDRRFATLDWQELRTCAVGVRRIRERAASVVGELTITDGISWRDVVVKQQKVSDEENQEAVRRARAEFEVLTRLRASLDLPDDAVSGVVYSVPRVVVFDEPRAAIVMSRAVGKPLDALIRSVRKRGTAGRLFVPLRRAGAWLRRMQSATRSGEDGRHLLTAVVVLAMRDLSIAAVSDRKLRKQQERVVETLQSLEARVAEKPLPVVGSHGDYRPANIFVGPRRVDVIDFETYREGVPVEDVGAFLVHLNLGFAYPVLRRLLPRLEQAFLEGYGPADELDADALRLFKIVRALQLLARPRETQTGLKSRLHRRILRSIVIG